MSLGNKNGVMRMCARCGFTEILEQGISPPIYDWLEVEGGVIGDDCTTVVAAVPSTTDLGYTPLT